MPVSWKRIVEQQQTYTEADFQSAAMRLINEQVLYQANTRQRIAYDLVSKYVNEFTEALDLFGCVLDHNEQARYFAAIPKRADAGKIPLMHTLLALVLRQLYDYYMNKGALNAGVAGVSISELETAFNESTNRELPIKPRKDLMELLKDMQRWGIARAAKDPNGGDTYVEILPGIQSLITEGFLASLKSHAESMYEPEQLDPEPESVTDTEVEA